MDSFSFLGYIIINDWLHIPTDEVKAISEVPIPKNVHELKAFLGLVNYYGKFIQNMSTSASPLYALLKDNTKFIWSQEQNKGDIMLLKKCCCQIKYLFIIILIWIFF